MQGVAGELSDISLYKPSMGELWFREAMLADARENGVRTLYDDVRKKLDNLSKFRLHSRKNLCYIYKAHSISVKKTAF